MQRLSHVIEGEGDPLLLIHGMGSASTAWKLVKPELRRDYKVITVDLEFVICGYDAISFT